MTASPFLVHVARLRRSNGSRTHEQRSGAIAASVVTGSRVPEGSEVAVDVVLESMSGGIEAYGTVEATLVGRLQAVPRRGHRDPRAPGPRALHPVRRRRRDIPLADDTVDLEVLAHDAILLELPPAPLCRPDCLGLCSTCGADLNERTCDCEPPAIPGSPPWTSSG